MFARHKYDGSELTRDWARLRNEIEPLVEATQLKGDSEAHPVLSPDDEFADFETWGGAGAWRGARSARRLWNQLVNPSQSCFGSSPPTIGGKRPSAM